MRCASLIYGLIGGGIAAAAILATVAVLGNSGQLLRLAAPAQGVGLDDWRLWVVLAVMTAAAGILRRGGRTGDRALAPGAPAVAAATCAGWHREFRRTGWLAGSVSADTFGSAVLPGFLGSRFMGQRRSRLADRRDCRADRREDAA